MQKLPKKSKQLRGTYRSDRESGGIDAGDRLKTAPKPPDTLSVGAKSEWEALAPVLVALGILTVADLRTLELLCETLSTATALEETIRIEGFTIAAATGGHKAHPALKALETTRNAACRMLSDFGLNPRARKFVERAPEKYKEADHGFGSHPTRRGPRPLR
jgi:P27 family predicted phage terminase small subunit